MIISFEFYERFKTEFVSESDLFRIPLIRCYIIKWNEKRQTRAQVDHVFLKNIIGPLQTRFRVGDSLSTATFPRAIATCEMWVSRIISHLSIAITGIALIISPKLKLRVSNMSFKRASVRRNEINTFYYGTRFFECGSCCSELWDKSTSSYRFWWTCIWFST